jgi:hypothetical protein
MFCLVCDGWQNRAMSASKLGKFATKTPEMLCEAFVEHPLSQTTVFEWHSRFKSGRVSVEDDEHSG